MNSTYTRMLLLRVVGIRLATRKGNYMVSRHLHGDMNELDQITDEPHDRETNRDSLGNLNKLYAPKWCINGCSGTAISIARRPFREGFVHRTRNCGGHEEGTCERQSEMTNLVTLADKLLWYLKELLNLLGHYVNAKGRKKDKGQGVREVER